MSSIVRNTLVVVTGVVALSAASLVAAAGITGDAIEKARDRAEARTQSEPKRAPRPQAPAAQPQAAPAQSAPASAPREPRPNFRNIPQEQRSSPAPARAPVAQAPSNRGNDSGNRGNGSRGNGNGNDNSARGNDRNRDLGVVGGSLSRNLRDNEPGRGGNGRGDSRGDRDDRNGTWRNDNRAPRVVQRLPPGYRNYNWNGRPYYTHGGRWYQPYGSSYISIGVPYGLFVSSLPGYSSSFYFGNSRYYYYDDTYYLYEPARRGYVVTRSPYNDDEEDDYYYDDALDAEMYVYPSRGQSEQQQADDRYECHRWAVSETDYDPIDDEYDRELRAEYNRALTACLTGRGYSVR